MPNSYLLKSKKLQITKELKVKNKNSTVLYKDSKLQAKSLLLQAIIEI